MAITKSRKQELVAEYRRLIEAHPSLILASFAGMNVKSLDQLRRRIRETGGEFHVVKNRLIALALKERGLTLPGPALEGSTIVGFAGEDIPAVAKAIVEVARQSEALAVKGGIVDGIIYDGRQVERLADLPPLAVLRAQFLGVLSAPAGRVAGALAGSVRQVMNVVKAYAESPAAAGS
ncbi:MAG TPA: 50S ribosomal protein L10 [Anaerolineales bacterium]|nr:50S ribosomal protein L10 [Anaerolineales bacterium]